MGMNVGGRKGGPMADINITPLVDVVLVLLIIFMVVYAIVFTAGSIYMARIATRGFKDDAPEPPEREHRAPGSPLAAVEEPAETGPRGRKPAE